MTKFRLDPLQLAFASLTSLLAIVAGVLVFADQRELLGAPLWMKPFKFFLSATLMSLTLSYVIPRISKLQRLVKTASIVIVVSLSVELALITWAAASETTSHFNVSSPLAIAVWAAMAGFITAVWVATILLTLAYLRAGQDSPLIKRSLVWGMGVSLVGMAVAFLMTGPNAEQLQDFQGIAGAHTVGAADGGPGLPLFGWSTEAGDLRIPHFFGLHALQVIPILALLLRRQITLRVVNYIGFGYLLLIVVLTYQALIGESIIDTSLGTAIGILTAIALPIIGAVVESRRAVNI